MFSRTKLGYTAKKGIGWEQYGFITFMLAYGFLINAIGILLSTLVAIKLGMIFFGANIISVFGYSVMEMLEDHASLWGRLRKDSLFIGALIVGGILPSIGILKLVV